MVNTFESTHMEKVLLFLVEGKPFIHMKSNFQNGQHQFLAVFDLFGHFCLFARIDEILQEAQRDQQAGVPVLFIIPIPEKCPYLTAFSMLHRKRFSIEAPADTQLYVYAARTNVSDILVTCERLMGSVQCAKRLSSIRYSYFRMPLSSTSRKSSTFSI